jgi:hypothetical protein
VVIKQSSKGAEMTNPDRITLERYDEQRYRVPVERGDAEGHGRKLAGFSGEEGDVKGHGRNWGFSEEEEDTEGHGIRGFRFSVEPAGEDEQGEPLYRIAGEDAEGHGKRFGA